MQIMYFIAFSVLFESQSPAVEITCSCLHLGADNSVPLLHVSPNDLLYLTVTPHGSPYCKAGVFVLPSGPEGVLEQNSGIS